MLEKIKQNKNSSRDFFFKKKTRLGSILLLNGRFVCVIRCNSSESSLHVSIQKLQAVNIAGVNPAKPVQQLVSKYR